MDSHKQSVFDQMKMMGFPEDKVSQAWGKSDIKTTEGLILWIENNIDKPQTQNPINL